MTKTRLMLILMFLGGCFYFYQIIFDEPREEYTIVTRTTVLTTRPLTSKRDLDFLSLSHDLVEYSLTHSNVLEEKLFPWWLNRRSEDHSKRYSMENDTSKGIVICTGDKHFRLTLVALRGLALIGNELPIEVIFSTSNDLSLQNRQELEKLFPNIRLIDLSSKLFDDNYLELRGWEIKPFAVLASQFRQVLLMDSDVLFLEKPSILFENSYYLKSGSLFFYDRIILSEDIIHWIKTFSIDNNNQSFPKYTQESGVVLIDKSRVLDGLLSICKLNDHREREEVTYRHLYGDKDTWWIGFHLIKMHYSFIPTLTGSIGQIIQTERNKMVCGHILHFDENLKPIWWNGGMFKNRYFSQKQLINIDGWLEGGRWTIKAHSCLKSDGQTPKRFTQNQQELINNYSLITKKIFNID